MKYSYPEENHNVRIITEEGEIILEPGTYITPKALDTKIKEELGDKAITFGTLRKQIQNHKAGIPLNISRLLTMAEASMIRGLIGQRGKHDRRK